MPTSRFGATAPLAWPALLAGAWLAFSSGCYVNRPYLASGWTSLGCATCAESSTAGPCDTCGDGPLDSPLVSDNYPAACGECVGGGLNGLILPLLSNRLACGSGCGEVYWNEWMCDPPDCTDPCDEVGCWVGARACAPCRVAHAGVRGVVGAVRRFFGLSWLYDPAPGICAPCAGPAVDGCDACAGGDREYDDEPWEYDDGEYEEQEYEQGAYEERVPARARSHAHGQPVFRPGLLSLVAPPVGQPRRGSPPKVFRPGRLSLVAPPPADRGIAQPRVVMPWDVAKSLGRQLTTPLVQLTAAAIPVPGASSFRRSAHDRVAQRMAAAQTAH